MQTYAFLFAASVASAASHANLPVCACHAADLGFTIDCKTPAPISTAYEYCKANCLTDCTSAACKKNFAIVESHHDFCLHDQVPHEVEVGFHSLEDICARECVIGRLRDPDHSACPTFACPKYAFQVEEIIETLADGGCATTCPEATCGDAFRKVRIIHDTCGAINDKAFEWAGIFAVSKASHTWSMQKTGTAGALAYADPAMKIAIIPVTPAPATEAAGVAKIEELEHKGSNLLIGTCTEVADAGSMKPDAAGSCFQLKVGTGDDSTFTIDTTGLVGLAVFAEHVPLEFERDKHYLYDVDGTDIEPTAQENVGAFEWAGVFPMADTTHTWSMQKTGTPLAYADPAMKLALVPVSAATKAKMEEVENKGANLVAGTCTDVADKGTMKPDAAGSCFNLKVGTGDDSTFTIDSTGLTALAVFAQHVPIEFERDKHYLYDSANKDIEPAAEESAGPGHDHGHRRLADIDAALHTYEDACDPVGCYVEGGGCAAGTPDLTKLDTLKDRAGKKCHVTEEEGITCPTSVASDSGVKPVEFLTGVALLLTATMH
jgi:hypothetical protein